MLATLVGWGSGLAVAGARIAGCLVLLKPRSTSRSSLPQSTSSIMPHCSDSMNLNLLKPSIVVLAASSSLWLFLCPESRRVQHGPVSTSDYEDRVLEGFSSFVSKSHHHMRGCSRSLNYQNQQNTRPPPPAFRPGSTETETRSAKS